MNKGNNPVLIAANIKNKSIVTNSINTIKGLFYGMEIIPIAYQTNVIP